MASEPRGDSLSSSYPGLLDGIPSGLGEMRIAYQNGRVAIEVLHLRGPAPYLSNLLRQNHPATFEPSSLRVVGTGDQNVTITYNLVGSSQGESGIAEGDYVAHKLLASWQGHLQAVEARGSIEVELFITILVARQPGGGRHNNWADIICRTINIATLMLLIYGLS